jgi:hypothetical protein
MKDKKKTKGHNRTEQACAYKTDAKVRCKYWLCSPGVGGGGGESSVEVSVIENVNLL